MAQSFAGIGTPDDQSASVGLLHARGENSKTLRFLSVGLSGETIFYDLDADLKLRRKKNPADAAWMLMNVAFSAPLINAGAASYLFVDEARNRWRLPKGDQSVEQRDEFGKTRVCAKSAPSAPTDTEGREASPGHGGSIMGAMLRMSPRTRPQP